MNIVVSGASRGIGAETVKLFAEKGHHVLAIARSEQELLKLSQNSKNVEVLVLDLSNAQQEPSKFQSMLPFATIDIVINNAGALINKPFLETSSLEFVSQFQSNVLTAVNLSQLCVPFMTRKSHIVNISSMGGVQGSSKFKGLSAYSTAKGAISILTECMSVELAEAGISVNALALGAVQTKMLEKAFPEFKAPINPEEMAQYIVEFASNGNKFYNGKVLPVALGNP